MAATIASPRRSGAMAIADPTRMRTQSGGATTVDPTQWWNAPDLLFQDSPGAGGAGPATYWRTRTDPRINPATVPNWAPEAIRDPRTFYSAMQALPEDLRWTVEADSRSTQEANEMASAARAASIETLGGSRRETDMFRRRAMNSPVRRAMEQNLIARSNPNYRAISELEEGDYRNQLAQSIAQAQARALARAGGRGAAFSGTTAGYNAGVAGQAEAAGVGLSADIAARNRAARDLAGDELSRLYTADAGLERSYLDALRQIDAGIAQLQLGNVIEPTDYMPLAELGFARSAYDDQLALTREALGQQEEALKFGPEDWADLLLRIPGTGLAGSVLGLFT